MIEQIKCPYVEYNVSEPYLPPMEDMTIGLEYTQVIKETRVEIDRVRATTHDPAAIKILQTELSKQGFDPGPIDGIYGPKSRGALVRYANSKNLTSKTITDEIINSLRLTNVFLDTNEKLQVSAATEWADKDPLYQSQIAASYTSEGVSNQAKEQILKQTILIKENRNSHYIESTAAKTIMIDLLSLANKRYRLSDVPRWRSSTRFHFGIDIAAPSGHEIILLQTYNYSYVGRPNGIIISSFGLADNTYGRIMHMPKLEASSRYQGAYAHICGTTGLVNPAYHWHVEFWAFDRKLRPYYLDDQQQWNRMPELNGKPYTSTSTLLANLGLTYRTVNSHLT
jgi:peptidoglycan hydrolase-like protein with peptidoglycan-binding domain